MIFEQFGMAVFVVFMAYAAINSFIVLGRVVRKFWNII